jgi:hypothetical protein
MMRDGAGVVGGVWWKTEDGGKQRSGTGCSRKAVCWQEMQSSDTHGSTVQLGYLVMEGVAWWCRQTAKQRGT